MIKTKRLFQEKKLPTGCFEHKIEKQSDVPCSFFHWFDLNSDGHEDLIFSGPCMPYLQTDVYLWSNGNYKFVYGSGGEIVKIIKYPDSTILFLRIDGCCCEVFSSLHKIIIPRNSMELIDTAYVAWHVETGFTQINKTWKFIGMADTIALRIAPERNNTIMKTDCTDGFKKGNITIEFKKEISGLILKDTISNGENWYLIMVQPNNLKIESEFEGQYFKINKTYSIGWVRKPEIEIIQ
jgi:hypothetical protein